MVVDLVSESLRTNADGPGSAALESPGAVPSYPSIGVLLLVTVSVTREEQQWMLATSFGPEKSACGWWNCVSG